MANMGKHLLNLMGGEDNIDTITHCATRLRISLVDNNSVDMKSIESTKGVASVVDTGSQIQIVIGTNVPDVYAELIDGTKFQEGIKNEVNNSKNERGPKETETKKGYFGRFIEIVVSIFMPLLPLLAGSGLLKGLTILAERMGVLSESSSTYTILAAASSAVFYFLPLLVAVSTARRFKADPFVALAVMGALLLPDFQDMLNGEVTTVSFMGIPTQLADYSSSIIPAVLAIITQAKLEQGLKKVLPQSLHMIAVPLVVLFFIVPLTAIVYGPLGTQLSFAVANGANLILSLNGWVTGAIIGGIWNILIMFGIHWAVNSTVVIPNIATLGFSKIIAISACANFGMAGAALGTFFISKDRELKSFSLSAIVSVFLSGIVEPAIYGVGVKYKRPLIAGVIGAAAGGSFMGGMGTIGYTFVFGGLTTIPAFIGPTIASYLIGLAISFVIGAILTMIFGIKENVQPQSSQS